VTLGAAKKQGWQYTSWGMSPEQVVRASAGEARLISDQDKPGERILGDVEKVRGHSTSGSLRFDTQFFFDSNNGLSLVILTLQGDPRQNYPILETALLGKYGAPIEDKFSRFDRKRRWVSGNTVELDQVGSPPTVPTLVQLYYWPAPQVPTIHK